MQEMAGSAEILARGVCLLGLAYIALQDLRHFRIPDHASIALALLGAARALWLQPDRLVELLAAGLIAGGAFWVIALVFERLRGREGLGLGDVKLAGVMGLWLGTGTALAILIGTGLALLVTLALIVTGRRTSTDPIPLGSYLAGGFAALLFV